MKKAATTVWKAAFFLALVLSLASAAPTPVYTHNPFLGSGTDATSADGTDALTASINGAEIAVHPLTDELYFMELCKVRKVDKLTNQLVTISGGACLATSAPPTGVPGLASGAAFSSVTLPAFDGLGNLYFVVTASTTQSILKIDLTVASPTISLVKGGLTTIGGLTVTKNGQFIYLSIGTSMIKLTVSTGATASLLTTSGPSPIALSKSELSLYYKSNTGYISELVIATKTSTVVAGNGGIPSGSIDQVDALSAPFGSITSLVADVDGNILFSAIGTRRVFYFEPVASKVSQIVGDGGAFAASDVSAVALSLSLSTTPKNLATSSLSRSFYVHDTVSGVRAVSEHTTPSLPPTVSITSSSSSALETSSAPVTFTVTRVGDTLPSIDVILSFSGSAVLSTDYSLSNPAIYSDNKITIAAGQSSATFTLTPIQNTVVNSDRTFIVSIDTDAAYVVGTPSSQTFTITNVPPVLSISLSPSSQNEGSSATFTITSSFAVSTDITVSIALSGTATISSDYTSEATTSVVILANQLSKTFNVATLTDNVVDDGETVIATIQSGSGYTVGSPSSQTLTIVDTTPEITITVNIASQSEGGGAVTFTLSRTKDTSSALDVSVDISGTATFDTDYTSTLSQFGANTVTFSSGSSTATFTVTPSSDALTTEGSETVIATITSGSTYAVGTPSSQTLTITDSGSGSGDPHMVGFHGQRFDFPGKAGKTYNVLSDPLLQVNTLMGLLRIGEHSFVSGPVMVQMAFLTLNHTVLVNAGGYLKEESGFVSVDDMFLIPGTSLFFDDDKLSVSFSKLNVNAKDLGLAGEHDHIVAQVDIRLEKLFEFKVFLIENGRDPKNPDHWLLKYPRRLLDFNVSLLDHHRRPHGILGQTASPLSKGRSVEDWKIEGKDEDYVVKDGLTGSLFSFNQFN